MNQHFQCCHSTSAISPLIVCYGLLFPFWDMSCSLTNQGLGVGYSMQTREKS